MEVSGVVSAGAGAGLDTQSSSSKLLVRFSGCDGDYCKPKKVSCAMRSSRKVCRLSKSGFSDNGHLHYYVSPKAGFKEKESLKKKLKLVEGMSKDLLRFSSMGFGEEIKGMNISEATEILLSQLKQLKAEEKELKTKRKQEKAILKASGASSSSSSESSDNETRQVIDMASLTSAAPKPIEPQVEFETQPTSPISTPTSGSAEISVTIGDKIEVCTGRKCNKSGATALIKEFQQRLGGEDAVVGCKCMGKCKEGPNVRVLTHSNQTNPLCLGVGLDDVGTIVSNFFGEGRKDLGLMVV